MSKGGTITIKELITDDAINWGSVYQKNVEKAIATNQQFVASVKELVALYPQLKAVKSEGDYVSSKEKEAQLIRVTTSTMKEQQKVVQDLVRTKAQLLVSENDESRRLADLKVSRQLQNKTIREEAVLNNALVGSYQKLNTQREQAKTKLRDLIASEKASNQEIRKAQAEYDRLHAKVVKADRATSDFTKNVGNYQSAFGKGIYAVQSLAGAFGLLSAIGIGTMIFNQVRELNALESALKKVTETADGYAQAQSYIIELSRISGVEYKILTKTYTSFYASARNTNLTLEETQKIFSAVTKASSVLGVSADDTEGSLRALGQMLSKGKIQAEELRGQLGDRMPGAFQIMAKAMNVTTAELDKMLKDGKVIAEEVLPKFAEELERAFGVDNNNKIETLNASIGRMKTEWTLFLKGIEGEQGVVSNFFKTFTDGISNLIKGFNDLNRVTSIVGAPKWYEILGAPNQTAEIMKQYNGIIQTLDTTYSKIEKMQYNDATIEFLSDYIYKTQLHMEEIDNLSEKKLLQYQIDRVQAFITRKYTESLEENTDEIVKNTDETDKNTKSKSKIVEALEGTVAWYDEQIKLLRDEQRTLVTTTEQYAVYESAIKSVEEQKAKLIDTAKELIKSEEESAKIMGGVSPISESELPAQRVLGIQIEARKRLRELDEDDLQDWKDKWNKRIEIVQSAIGEISNLVSAVFQNRIESIQAEMDANEDYYQHQMTLAEDDSVQQNLLEEERFRKQEILRKKQLAEKQKQAKYEKAFNVMKTIMDTASAVVEALPNIPLSIFAGAIGAIQLATVLATPIPKYKQGTDFHKGGLAIVGDGGVNEIVKEPSKPAYLTPNKDTLLNLERGTKVYKSKDDYLKEFKMLERASILTSLQSQSEKVKELSLLDKFDRNMTNISNEIKKGFKNVKIQNQNNTNINLDYYLWKNKNAQF